MNILLISTPWVPTPPITHGGTDIFMERKQAVINYPTFSRKEIQMCHDIFNILLSNTKISLDQPFNSIVEQCH